MISPTVDFIIYSSCTVLGLLVNSKFLHLMKTDQQKSVQRGQREGMLVKDVMTTFTIVNMVFYPLRFFAKWYVRSELPLPDWMYHCYCYQRLFLFSVRGYLAFSSLVVAAMRFAFIVHNDKVVFWGQRRVKKLFHFLSIFIPLTFALMYDSTYFRESSTKPPPFFLCLKSYEIATNSSATEYSINVTSFQSPMQSFVHQYVPRSITDVVSNVCGAVFTIVFSNLAEGILYWKIYSRVKGYVFRCSRLSLTTYFYALLILNATQPF